MQKIKKKKKKSWQSGFLAVVTSAACSIIFVVMFWPLLWCAYPLTIFPPFSSRLMTWIYLYLMYINHLEKQKNIFFTRRLYLNLNAPLKTGIDNEKQYEFRFFVTLIQNCYTVFFKWDFYILLVNLAKIIYKKINFLDNKSEQLKFHLLFYTHNLQQP